MASITGKAGAVTLDGGALTGAVTGKVREWSVELEAGTVDDTGMGDTWKSQVPLTNSWVARFTAIMPTGTSAEFYPSLLGTDVAVGLTRAGDDPEVLFADTGILKNITLTHPATDLSVYEVVVEGNDGSAAPTFETDQTPP